MTRMRVEVTGGEVRTAAYQSKIRVHDTGGDEMEEVTRLLDEVAAEIRHGYETDHTDCYDCTPVPQDPDGFWGWMQDVCVEATGPVRLHPRRLFGAISEGEVWDQQVPGPLATRVRVQASKRRARDIAAEESDFVVQARARLAAGVFAVMCRLFEPGGRAPTAVDRFGDRVPIPGLAGTAQASAGEE